MKKHRHELSVVMSAYQRAQFLPWTLLSILNQEDKPDEIVFVDDGSTDNTEFIVKDFTKKYPECNIKYIYNHSPGWNICCVPMNIGIKQATGDILLLTEPEILHPTPSVKIAREFFSNSENDRKILIANPLYGIFSRVQGELTDRELTNPIEITRRPEVKEWYNGFESQPQDITYMPKGGTHHIAAILKKHMMAIGGYDEEFLLDGCHNVASGYDDIDMLTRLKFYGVIEERTPDIIAIHMYHDPPPQYTKNPELIMKNLERMQTRERLMSKLHTEGKLVDEWRANKNKEWGVLNK